MPQYLPTPVQNFFLGLVRNQTSIPSPSTGYGLTSGSWQNNYETHARAFLSDPIVATAIRLLATSAAEPVIIGRRMRRARPSFASARFAGPQAYVRNQMLITNGYVEELPAHPLVKLLNNPNPYATRAKLMTYLVMDRYIGGNAYCVKLRGAFGNVAELWRVRPDRMRIIPDGNSGIAAYEYKNGDVRVLFPEEDVIHWAEPNPFDDFNGVSPMSSIMPYVQVAAYMREMLGQFYASGGSGPGAILTTSGKLPPEAKEEIRSRLRRMLNSPGSFRETLVLEQGTSTYQRLGLDNGLVGAVPKDINAMLEANRAMPFGIPGSILGLLIGFESSSYANKRADWQVLWDITMTPLMSDFDDGFSRSLCQPHGDTPAEFGGIDEVMFDLSDIRALQEDIDALHTRARSNVDAGLWTVEEGRLTTGMPDSPQDGDHLLLPTKSTLVPTPIEDIAPENPEPMAVPAKPGEPVVEPTPAKAAPNAVAAAFRQAFSVTVEKPKMLEAPRVGRRPLVEDAGARALFDEGEALRRKHPGMTYDQIAARLGITDRTYRNYRATFGD